MNDIAGVDELSAVAERSTRLGAVLLDGVIFSAMVYIPLLIAMMIAGAAGSRTAILLALLPVGGLVAWAWMTVRYVRDNGQSIAKKILGIKVVRTDGAPASLARVFWLRNVVNGAISIIPLYGIIDSLFIFGEARKCLHDRIADTIVVKA